MEKFEHKGVWWIPDQPENQISGILRYDPIDGANLELIGSFVQGFGKSLDHIQIVHGIITDATKVTLWQCDQVSHGHSIKDGHSFNRSTYTSLFFFSGYHFASSEDVLFESLSINFSNVEEWANTNPFEANDSNFPVNFSVSFKKPNEIKAELEEVTVKFRHILSVNSRNMQSVSLKQTALFSLTLHSPLNFDVLFRGIVYDLRNLLSLGIGQAIYPQIVAGSIPEVSNEVKVYFATGQPTKLLRIRHAHQMLFTLSDIASNFEETFKAWFALSKTLDPVFELYFGILYNPSIPPKVEFLLLAQALEAYHRNIYKGFYVSSDEYKLIAKTLKTAIPDNLTDEHKTNLKSRIDFGNEYTLLTRLKLILGNVLKPYKSQLDKLIGNQDEFAKTLKATRNNLTHHNDDKNALTDSRDIDTYAQKMKVILQMCFLVELGFSSVQISKMIVQSRLYQNLTT